MAAARCNCSGRSTHVRAPLAGSFPYGGLFARYPGNTCSCSPGEFIFCIRSFSLKEIPYRINGCACKANHTRFWDGRIEMVFEVNYLKTAVNQMSTVWSMATARAATTIHDNVQQT